MRAFTCYIFLPSLVALGGLVLLDRARGTGHLSRSIGAGALAGLTAAVAYDVFRLPFVFAGRLRISHFVPQLNLFKVFPQFGAMILAQPLQQSHYSVLTQVVGWSYHFSNGLTFGVMYVALVGNPVRRHWFWAVIFAVVLEVAMLVSPYAGFFNIPLTGAFIGVTLLVHVIFGVVMGVSARGFLRGSMAGRA